MLSDTGASWGNNGKECVATITDNRFTLFSVPDRIVVIIVIIVTITILNGSRVSIRISIGVSIVASVIVTISSIVMIIRVV